MKKLLAVGIIVLFVGASVVPSVGMVEISYNGRGILYVGGSGPGNYTSIQDAIDNASDGDTVFVYDDSSPYYENVVADKSISLIGENKNNTIIDGNNVGDVTVRILVDNVNISGFTIQESGNGYSGLCTYANNTNISNNIVKSNGNHGIIVRYWNNNIMSNNIVFDNQQNGINVQDGSKNNIIEGNAINSNSNDGIALYSSDNNHISWNNIRNNSGDGVDMDYSSNNTISYNNINKNFMGITLFYNCNDNIITWNDIRYNKQDPYERYGIFLHHNSNSNIIGNNVITNHKYGINQQSGSNNTFSGNVIENNSVDGIAMFSGSNNIISGNLIENNDRWGISPGSNNIIIDNDIKNNGDDGISSVGNNNTIIGNFIQGNGGDGIYLQMSDNNHITGNAIMNNIFGMRIRSSSDNNDIYHNNLINNTQNAYDECDNNWDGGYPSGGNYWSDYIGEDHYSGPNQSIPGSDGIGDTPYDVLGGDNQDSYPFMNPNGWNNPPFSFNISGPHYGMPGVLYSFCVEAVDPNGDEIYCMWDWGDGTYTDWLGPYASGEIICESHGWIEVGTYEIKVKLKDQYGMESEWSEPFIIIIEDELPQVNIVTPEKRFLYLNFKDRILLKIPFLITVIIGQIDIEVDAEDGISGVDKVVFYIDDELKYNDTAEPYNWTWDEQAFFRHTIKVTAFDNAGNSASDEIKVWKFF